MAYSQVFNSPHSWKDIWNEARKQCGGRRGVLSVTAESLNDLVIWCGLIPKFKTDCYSCQIRIAFPNNSRPVFRVCKTLAFNDSILPVVNEARQLWGRERKEMEGLGWKLTKNLAARGHYVTWERKLGEDCRVYIGRDISQSKNGYTEKRNWNQCLAQVGEQLWAWRVYSPDGPIVAAVALTVNCSQFFLPTQSLRNLRKKEIDMAMGHGLENITWETAWKQQ